MTTYTLIDKQSGEAIRSGLTAENAAHAVEQLADAFWREIRTSFTPAEIAEIRRRNRAYAAAGSSACATHDFCDANEIMFEAFKAAFERPPLFLADDSYDCDEDAAQPDFDLWNRAWERTRAARLT